MRRSSFVVALLSLVVLAGCLSEKFGICVDDPTDPRCVADAGDAGVHDAGDAGPRDSGDAAIVDEGVDEGTPDAGPCGALCTGMTPVCDAARGLCAECTAADASACTGATPVCDTTSGSVTEGRCVPCNVHGDCASLAAPECDTTTHTCVPCTGDAACAARSGMTVCGAGACVECTTADRTACGVNVCAPAARTCTTLLAAALQACQECVHDAQCQDGQLCVEQRYGDPPPDRAVGRYCLWRRSTTGVGAPNGACGLGSRPYASARMVTSTDGIGDTVCELATTTCPALLQHRTAVTGCTTAGTDDGACGVPTFNDGRCRLNGSMEPRCTYPCGGTEDCRAGFTCPGAGDQFCSI